MAKDPKWAVMVFMGAERVPGDADLLEAALDDLDEMSTLFPRPSDRLNLFAQINSGGEAQRYDVGRAKKTAVAEGERDATDGNALLAFIRWALRISGDQDDVYTMLVLWGHAYQFAIGRAAGPTGIEALDFGELADVLARLQKERRKPLNILGFDACDLASIEIAFQFQPYVDYLLASEIECRYGGQPAPALRARACRRQPPRRRQPRRRGWHPDSGGSREPQSRRGRMGRALCLRHGSGCGQGGRRRLRPASRIPGRGRAHRHHESVAGRRSVRRKLDARAVRRPPEEEAEHRTSRATGQLTVLRDRRAAHQSTHPFYWAGFVATGDWR